jgi:hypothetical protein
MRTRMRWRGQGVVAANNEGWLRTGRLLADKEPSQWKEGVAANYEAWLKTRMRCCGQGDVVADREAWLRTMRRGFSL